MSERHLYRVTVRHTVYSDSKTVLCAAENPAQVEASIMHWYGPLTVAAEITDIADEVIDGLFDCAVLAEPRAMR